MRDAHETTRLPKIAGGVLLGAAGTAAAADSPYDPNDPGEPTDLDEYDFILPRVRIVELPFKGRGKGPDVWNVRPGGDANLLRELGRIVRCRVKPIEAAIDWQPQYAFEGQLNAVVTFDDPDAASPLSVPFHDRRKPLRTHLRPEGQSQGLPHRRRLSS